MPSVSRAGTEVTGFTTSPLRDNFLPPSPLAANPKSSESMVTLPPTLARTAHPSAVRAAPAVPVTHSPSTSATSTRSGTERRRSRRAHGRMPGGWRHPSRPPQSLGHPQQHHHRGCRPGQQHHGCSPEGQRRRKRRLPEPGGSGRCRLLPVVGAHGRCHW